MSFLLAFLMRSDSSTTVVESEKETLSEIKKPFSTNFLKI
jgi:hypothetical protein